MGASNVYYRYSVPIFYLKAILIIAVSIIINISCGENNNKNKQPMDQYNLDKSNNYKYIFKDLIKKEKRDAEKKRRRDKDFFKE